MLLTLQVPHSDRSTSPWWESYPSLATLALLILATALCSVLDSHLDLRPVNLIMVYLLAVVAAAVGVGYWAAIAVSAISVPLFTFLFVEPRYAYGPDDPNFLLSFTAFFLTGTLISNLVEKLRERNLQLREDMLKLAEAEARLRLSSEVFDSSGEGITICDAAGNILMANRAFAEITGISVEQAQGKNLAALAGTTIPGLEDAAPTHWQGEIHGKRPDGVRYMVWLTIISSNLEEVGQHLIAIWSDITEQRSAESRVRFLAMFDSLTHLPNRHAIEGELKQLIKLAAQSHSGFALFFIDLDNFKSVNDSLGHLAGDKLLSTVAARLRAVLRDSDRIGRLGGDEFLILLPQLTQQQEITAVAQKLRSALAEPLLIDKHSFTATASIGISRYPADGADATTLVRHADVALYEAKAHGRDTHFFFTDSLEQKARHRFDIESALRQAIANDEFELWYQAQVDAVSGNLVGIEALIRWHHPQDGLLAPGRFLPVAESSRLIVAIGEWVLNAGCRQVALWRDQGMPVVPLAVNLSPLQMQEPGLDALLSGLLKTYGLKPADLELEITETALMGEDPSILALMERLSKMGFRFAIDDFGTGYSSLAYLRRYPFHKLKIDQSFVRDITQHEQDRGIVETIVAIARQLKLKVIAEGVETEAQMLCLRDMDCPVVQGYLINMPMPADEFSRRFSSERGSWRWVARLQGA